MLKGRGTGDSLEKVRKKGFGGQDAAGEGSAVRGEKNYKNLGVKGVF